jgi:AraC-like DNA-binding protein
MDVRFFLPMQVTSSKTLLPKFSLHNARDADSLGVAMAPFIGENNITPERDTKDLRALMNLRRLRKSALFYGRFEQPFSVEIAHSPSFLHGFPLRGHAQHINNGMLIPDSPGRGAVGGPGPLKLTYGANFEIFALFIRPEALSATLSALVGVPTSVPLRLDRSNYEGRPETPTLRDIVRTMIGLVDSEGSQAAPHLLAELEHAAMVAFLCGTIHNHTHLLAAPVRAGAPWQVRRVEDYIEANWNQPITVEALAALTNASVRSVFHTFKEYRGYSPMSFVKQVRLRRAREMLAGPSADLSITNVALICGFGNLGHFANDYFKVFGEKPSATRSQIKSRS